MRKPKRKKRPKISKAETDKKMLLSANRATVERALEEQQRAEDLARKNNGFTQLDDVGVRSLEKLIEKSPKAGNLFLRLAREMDPRGAVVASRQVLAEIAGVDPSNVSKLLKLMVDNGLIRDTKQGNHRIIAINPEVAWRSWNSGKQYAFFNARVILRSDEWESEEEWDIRRANALIKMAKKARGRKPTKERGQSTFPAPLDPVPSIKTELVKE